MSINGVSQVRFGIQASAALIVAGVAFSSDVMGQTVAPQPLARPYGLNGPTAQPYGVAPMPIAPAPYPYGPYAYGPVAPVVPWQPYPTSIYPVDPYWGRPVTPFEANRPDLRPRPLYPLPVPAETYHPSNPAIESQAVVAPIGNLRLTISEAFLNRLIARQEQRPGEDVKDFILGADVSGRQTTQTSLRFDLIPSVDRMRGAFVLNGTTESQTTGVTPQASVDVASRQQFTAIKELYFDGTNFSTRHATVHVQATNKTLGATTPLSGTLFGGIADRIAYREAERRKPAAEAIARDKVAERVFPEFDQQIDKQLADANQKLETLVRRKLRENNLMPVRQQVSSTDLALNYSVQLGDEQSLPSTANLERRLSRDESVSLLVHESLVNTLIANSGLKGLKTTDKEIVSFFGPYEYTVGTTEAAKPDSGISLPSLGNIVTNIEFDETDPVTLRYEQGRMVVIVKAKFKPAGQDLLPPLLVTIPYEPEVTTDKVILRPGSPQVELQHPDEDGNLTQGVALKLVKQGLETNLFTLAVDRALPTSFWPVGGVVPQITTVQSNGGWVAVSVR